jgi:hypothetical protein
VAVEKVRKLPDGQGINTTDSTVGLANSGIVVP